MSPTRLRLRISIFRHARPKQVESGSRQGFILTIALLLATTGVAQQSSPTPPPQAPDKSVVAVTASKATASVAAGTRIALVLTQPIQTRYLHRGDDIYAQITSPVTSGSEVVIPPGTFVQGKIDKLERQGGRGVVLLQSMAITFPDGYVTAVAGPVTLQSDDGYAIKDPGKGRIMSAIAAPIGGLGLGALVGHAAGSSNTILTSTLPAGCSGPPPNCLSSSIPAAGSGAKNTIIGAMVGGAAGGVVSIALLLSSHHFYLDVGSPVSMVLHQPLSLPEDEVADAIRDAEQHPAPPEPIVQRPQVTTPPPDDNSSGPTFCENPGSPGTPDIDIPGTPAVGDSPGTPPIHIPGIPATPPTTHLCP